MKLFEQITFPDENPEMVKEYLRLKKLEFRGDGESACMAYVKHTANILASSNLKDIGRYCAMHKLEYLTTMDFLCHALSTKKMSLAECNEFIKAVKLAKQKIPVEKMEDWICKNIIFKP